MNSALSQDLLLPEGTRLLHIGPPKTGTTGIQLALHRERQQLADLGVVVPGKGTRPRAAVWSLLGHPRGDESPPIKHWHSLVREVEAAGDARVCISTEDWARTDDEGAQATVDGLGGERVHVVAAARPLHRLLPSQWQQRVKMRATTLSYEDWLGIILGEADQDCPVWRNFWVPHDIASVAERWAKAAGGPDRFTLVVADEGDQELLPRTFEEMLGLPPGMLSAAVTDVRNPSISFGRVEGIRHLMLAFDEHGWRDDPELRSLLDRLSDAFKAVAPSEDEAKVPSLPRWAVERVAELSEQRVRTAQSLSVRVVGDPENLQFPESYDPSAQIPAAVVSPELSARVVERAVELLIEQQDTRDLEHRRKLARLRRKLNTNAGNRVDETTSAELLRVVAARVKNRATRRIHR